MTFADKSRYDRIFQQVTHKVGDPAMNYIRTLQNAQAFSVSLGNSYSWDQRMHIFLDNFHQGGKYTAQLDSHQAGLRIEGNITDQKYLFITFLQNDYLNIDSSSGTGRNNEGANIFQKIHFLSRCQPF